MIKRYCDEHPEKIVLATGDTNQLETIDVVSNQLNPDDYTNFCLNSIFKNLMFFQESKSPKKRPWRAKGKMSRSKQGVANRWSVSRGSTRNSLIE